jgi:hypothetical protein
MQEYGYIAAKGIVVAPGRTVTPTEHALFFNNHPDHFSGGIIYVLWTERSRVPLPAIGLERWPRGKGILAVAAQL